MKENEKKRKGWERGTLESVDLLSKVCMKTGLGGEREKGNGNELSLQNENEKKREEKMKRTREE